MDRKEIQDRIEQNKKALVDLDKKYLKAFAPEGYKSGTSYNDYDTIHGSRKSPRITEYFEERKKILTLIELDEGLLTKVVYVDEEEYLKVLDTNVKKVKFLRDVKGYTQQEVSDKLKLGLRTVQRIEKEIRNL
jgi:DNA-directed RNA polymerase specialized sigma24 family protein